MESEFRNTGYHLPVARRRVTEDDAMLVLSRKTGETLVLDGGRIVIKVMDVSMNRVRLGVEAPKDVKIDRGELHERKVAEGTYPAKAG